MPSMSLGEVMLIVKGDSDRDLGNWLQATMRMSRTATLAEQQPCSSHFCFIRWSPSSTGNPSSTGISSSSVSSTNGSSSGLTSSQAGDDCQQ